MWKFAVISLLTIFLVWLWKFFCWVWLEPRRLEKILRKQGLRGNSYRLFFGDTLEIAAMYKEAHSKPLGLLDDIVPRAIPFVHKTINTYGKNSFAWIGPRPRIYITDPELMREVLSNQRIHKNFQVVNKVYRLLVGGIVDFKDEKWKAHRTKYNPAFHVERLKELCPTVQTCCENTLNDWKKMMTDGSGTIDVFKYLGFYTSATVTTALFNLEFDEDMKKCFQLLHDLSILANINIKSFEIPGKRFLPTPSVWKAQAIEAVVRNKCRSMIDERLKKRRAGVQDRQDLFDLFIDDMYDERKQRELNLESFLDDAIGNIKSFFLSGYETTSNLLLWVMVNLAIHQDWQARAREEVYRVLGDRKKPTSDDLNQLKILKMIIFEVFRLFPSGVEVSRVTVEDVKVGDMVIPKGCLLQMPICILHRDPKIWGEDAHVFKPERFADGIKKAANGQAAFMPFGWGPRICIGQNLTMTESYIFIANLLMTFTWELSPEYTHAPYAPFTLKPQYGAPLILREINSS